MHNLSNLYFKILLLTLILSSSFLLKAGNYRFIIPRDSCIDLVFDTVKVLKITPDYVELEISVKNAGTIPVDLFGETRSLEDNVAIHFLFSGTKRLTRGAIMADEIFITEKTKNKNGILKPNEILTFKHKLSLEKKNRFSGVIILQLDAFDTVQNECDETNNSFFCVPKWYN